MNAWVHRKAEARVRKFVLYFSQRRLLLLTQSSANVCKGLQHRVKINLYSLCPAGGCKECQT